jgi:phage protein U
MFAILGEVEFAVLDSPERFESRREFRFAEHRVVEARPRLQWIHNGLETIALELLLHASFTDPAAQLAALRAAGEDHQARALVFGNGEHRGYFVVTALEVHSRQLDAWGNPIAIFVRLQLKEWAATHELAVGLASSVSSTPVALVPTLPGAFAPSGASSMAGMSVVMTSPTPTGATAPLIMPGDVPVARILRLPD